jgi:hypothetical protein
VRPRELPYDPSRFGIPASPQGSLPRSHCVAGPCPLAVILGEDVELAERAACTGHLRITRTASIPVVTSSRTAARAPGGSASYLAALGAPQ